MKLLSSSEFVGVSSSAVCRDGVLASPLRGREDPKNSEERARLWSTVGTKVPNRAAQAETRSTLSNMQSPGWQRLKPVGLRSRRQPGREQADLFWHQLSGSIRVPLPGVGIFKGFFSVIFPNLCLYLLHQRGEVRFTEAEGG